jgi:hypothetical protein
VKKRDPLALGANSRRLIYELNPGPAAALHRRLEIVHGEADVVNAGPSVRQEFPDWRGGIASLQKLDQRLARGEAEDAGPIGIVQRNLR